MPTATYTQFNCYEVLDVPPGAGPQEIRKACYRASLGAHPDHGGSHDRQVRINLAYEILKDPVHRQAHDRYWYPNGARASTQAPPPGQRTEPRTSTTRPRPRPQPLDHLYRRANRRMDERRSEFARQKQEKFTNTFNQFQSRFEQMKQARRNSFTWSCALTAAAVFASSANFHLVWIVAGVSWLLSWGYSSGVILHNRRVGLDEPNWRDALRAAATEKVEAESHADEQSLDRYRRILANLSELLGRSSSFVDSEDHVARRITAALFVMGYLPLHYDRQYRTLLFTDGEERLLVRYRHRAGAAMNITYVERMVGAMRQHGASTGLLFCTPGLSGNGAALAQQHGIKWYSLERMNEWIEQMSMGEYEGPSGDLFSYLDHLLSFLQSISIPLPYRGYRRRW